jgi:multidrug resistance efflux pump
MKGVLVVVIGVGSVVGLGSALCFQGDSGQVPVAAVVASSDRVTANGVVEGAGPEVALRAEVVGTLAAIHARENQEVKQGAILAELRNEVQQQQVALAKAEWAIATADLDRLRSGERSEKRRAVAAVEEAKRALFHQAEAVWERSRRLGWTGSTSAEQADTDYFHMVRARFEYKSAAAERALAEAPPRPAELAAAAARVAAAGARTRLAEAELAKTRVVAPTSGRVLQVFAEPGETAGPGSAQPVFLFADLSRRRVRAFVDELDVARVLPGQHAAVTADGVSAREFGGTVAVVMPRMGKRSPLSDAPGEYKDVYYREVLIDLDGGHELPANLRVHVAVQAGHPGN